MFGQDVCLFLCYCYTDDCYWLLNWRYVNKYFGSESYWFYTEIKKGFLLSPVYKHVKSICAYRAPDLGKLATHKHFFSKQTCLKNEWRNKLHY